MKNFAKTIKTASYLSGVLTMAAALLLVIFLVLSLLGLFNPRKARITLYTESVAKTYDSESVTCSEPEVSQGLLHSGHAIKILSLPEYTEVGEYSNAPQFIIVDDSGADVTAQYDITENFGTLTIYPIKITITTESAEKLYDGTPLSASGWSHAFGDLLPGHRLEMAMDSAITNTGTASNEGIARIVNENGEDVSQFYKIAYVFGTLEVTRIPLYITTGNAQKIYDGTPLTQVKWEFTGGNLEEGATIRATEQASLLTVGSIHNTMKFAVTDKNGADVTDRYAIECSYGTLTVQPKAITIRTGNATKPYDGTPLTCNDFTLIQGQLCQGEYIVITCASITNVGFSENMVLECTVYRTDDNGAVIDVTSCYRIAYAFGSLTITAK